MGGASVDDRLGGVGETGVDDVVKQGPQPEDLPRDGERLPLESGDTPQQTFEEVPSQRREAIKSPGGHIHHPKAMLEPGVGRTRVEQLRQRELTDVP
jgi:hypothetical protein